MIMMSSVLLSRFLGIFRESIIGHVGGVTAATDAYQISFIIPEILNHMLASGFLSITFIPIFSHYLVKDQKEEGFRIFSIILNTFGLLLLSFILASMIWAPQIVSIFAPGIKDPNTFQMAVKMTRIVIPAQFFFFSGGLFNAIQYANERFFFPALSGIIYNLSIIFGGLLLSPYIGMEGFAWGALAGAFIGNFSLQIIGVRRLKTRYFFIFSIRHPDLIKYVKLTIPLMMGLTMTFSLEILFKYFGSYLDPGSIAALNFSKVIVFALVGFFGQAVGVAAYPFMAKLAKNKDLTQLNQLLNTTLKFIFLVIPVSVLFMVLSHEIVCILFQWGKFNAAGTDFTAGILPFFLVGAFAFAAQTIVSRGYYATQNTIFPAIFTTICILLSLPVIFLFMKLMGAKGVALGLSITIAAQCFALYECWNRKSGNTGKKQVYFFFLKMIPLSLVLGFFLNFSSDFLRTIIDPSGRWGSLAVAICIGIEFCFLFLLAGNLLHIREITDLKDKVLKKLGYSAS